MFTASTHFCFTTSKLIGRLLLLHLNCECWGYVSRREQLADRWLKSDEGYAGSGRWRMEMHGLITGSLVTCCFFLSTESGCLRGEGELGTLWLWLPSGRPTQQAGSVFEAGAWITLFTLGKSFLFKRGWSTKRKREVEARERRERERAG